MPPQSPPKKRKEPGHMTPEQAAEAHKRWQQGESLRKLAPEYNVTNGTIHTHTKKLRDEHPRKVKRALPPPKPKKEKKRLQRSRAALYNPITAEIIAEAIRGWEEGIPLAQIALKHKVEYDKLCAVTAEGRKDIERAEISNTLTPKQITDIVSRWQNGETLLQIARKDGISHEIICNETKQAREAVSTGERQLSSKETEAALKRWENGEPLLRIARSYGADYTKLANDTKKVRKARQQEARAKTPLRSFLDATTIATVLQRWEAGDAPEVIAKIHHVSKKRIIEALIFGCWQRNEPLAQLVPKFGQGWDNTRKIIARYSALHNWPDAKKPTPAS